jgi:hypothetical protein
MEGNQLTEGRKDSCTPCTGCACSVDKSISFNFPFLVSFRHRPFQRPFSLVPLLAPIARAERVNTYDGSGRLAMVAEG